MVSERRTSHAKRAAAILCLLVAGCASVERLTFVPAAQIAATKKSDMPYTMKTCSQLAMLRDQTYADLSARSKAHDAGDQAGAGSMAQIADLKGEHNAITSTMAAKGCPN